MVTGAVFALGMAIVGVGVIRGAAAAEAAPITGFRPNLPLEPLPLINREEPSLSEMEGRAGDREQLKRYFRLYRRDWLRR